MIKTNDTFSKEVNETLVLNAYTTAIIGIGALKAMMITLLRKMNVSKIGIRKLPVHN